MQTNTSPQNAHSRGLTSFYGCRGYSNSAGDRYTVRASYRLRIEKGIFIIFCARSCRHRMCISFLLIGFIYLFVVHFPGHHSHHLPCKLVPFRRVRICFVTAATKHNVFALLQGARTHNEPKTAV